MWNIWSSDQRIEIKICASAQSPKFFCFDFQIFKQWLHQESTAHNSLAPIVMVMVDCRAMQDVTQECIFVVCLKLAPKQLISGVRRMQTYFVQLKSLNIHLQRFNCNLSLKTWSPIYRNKINPIHEWSQHEGPTSNSHAAECG